MKFNYQARTKEGEIQTGVVEASSKEAALNILQRYGFYVTYLKEVKTAFYAKKIRIFKGISQKDIVLFSRQLSILFGTKVPLVEALRVLTNQTENIDLREIVFKVMEEVEGGSPLSKALGLHPEVFSPFYIAMIKVGEVSGNLAESLNYLAEHLERDYHLASKVKTALIYPALVITVFVFVLGVMIFLVVPNIKEILKESAVTVPTITKMVIGLSDFLRNYSLLLIFGIFAVVFLIYRYHKTENGKNFFDKIFLKLPILGTLLKTIYVNRFAENLSTLIAGGLMVSQALELTANVIGNSIYKEAIYSTRDKVRKGVPISSVLFSFPEIFPPVFVQIISVGEKSGTLDTSLKKIADFYQREIERSIDGFLSILEPIITLVLGVVVGGLIFSILMPLYQTISI